jgi:nitroreductase
MDFLSLAKKRYACRKYAPAKVEQEKLDIILEAGRVAPTGANRQPQRLIVVRSQEGMERLARCTRDFGAPCAVIVCADTGEAWTRKYDGKTIGDIDASIVTDHMMLAAASLGLDTLWICMFKPEAVREEFRLPEHVEPVNILLIGYGIGTPADPRPSRPAAQTARGNGRIRNLLTGTESPNSPTAKAAVFANLRIRAHRKIPATTDSKK